MKINKSLYFLFDFYHLISNKLNLEIKEGVNEREDHKNIMG